MTKCTNPNCGYEWNPRVPNPKSCPACKQYLKEKKLQAEESKVK